MDNGWREAATGLRLGAPKSQNSNTSISASIWQAHSLCRGIVWKDFGPAWADLRVDWGLGGTLSDGSGILIREVVVKR